MKLVIDIDVDVEVPKINKVLFCIPLRLGLLMWGYIQLIISLIFFVYLAVDFSYSYRYANDKLLYQTGYGFNNGYSEMTAVIKIVIFIFFIIIWTPLETMSCGFLILGAHKNKGTYVEVSYYYFKWKVFAHGVLLVVCALSSLSWYNQRWYEGKVDGWTQLTMVYNPAIGALVWLIQLYLFLLINTLIIHLKHKPDYTTLYRRVISSFRNKGDLLDEKIVEEPNNEEKEKKSDDMTEVDLKTADPDDV